MTRNPPRIGTPDEARQAMSGLAQDESAETAPLICYHVGVILGTALRQADAGGDGSHEWRQAAMQARAYIAHIKRQYPEQW